MPMRHGSNSPRTLLATDPTDQDRASLTVDTVELEDILRQVDTENVNFHC